MVQAIFGLIQVMGTMYSKGKPPTSSDSIVEDKNTEDDQSDHDCRRYEHKYYRRQEHRSTSMRIQYLKVDNYSSNNHEKIHCVFFTSWKIVL
jgi:hypothetical protein